MEFKKKIKTRIYMAAAYIIIGIAMFLSKFYAGDAANDVISSIGIALAVGGFVRVARHVKLMRDPEKLRKMEIAETDERNVMIWERARSMAFAVYITLAAVVMIVLYILNMELAGQIVAYNICGFIMLYLVCYNIIKRKY